MLSSAAADRSAKILKSDVIKAVNELIEDIDTCHEQIAEQAVELIHHKYFLLTLSIIFCFLSSTPELFTDWSQYIIRQAWIF